MQRSRQHSWARERALTLWSMFCLGLTLLGFLACTDALSTPRPVRHSNANHDDDEQPSPSLAELALQKVLSDASPIFGHYHGQQKDTSNWMSAYPDDTLLTHMNLPGLHDAATWNYTTSTQQYLDHITQLVDVPDHDPRWFRCQDRSLVDALNDGIRIFDLRYAYDVTNSTLVFWHGSSMQSETATLDNVLFGYYQWLEDHPSEVVMLSFQYELVTSPKSTNDIGVQRLLYDALSSAAAKRYISQARSLGTLGESRGKIILLKRFELNLLPRSYGESLPGLDFPPSQWTDNGVDFTIVYSEKPHSTAHIEDYYRPETSSSSSSIINMQYKLNATIAALDRAATSHPDDLFWSFASSNNVLHQPPQTPRIMAIGNGSLTPNGGVNHHLLDYFKFMQGKRLGIVMFDYYEEPLDLLPTFLTLLPPAA